MASRRWLLPLTAAIFLTVLFFAAGLWQTHRAMYKESLQDRMAGAASGPVIMVPTSPGDAAQLEFRRLEAIGEWVADKTVFLDNKVRNGVVGYEVVTPLRIEHSDLCILVDRGWIAAPARRDQLPQILSPLGHVRLEGIARTPGHRFIELSDQGIVGQVWENLTLDRYARWSGLRLQPVMLYQTGGPEDSLARVTPAPEAIGLGADRHRGYAFMWFSLAALTVVITGILLFKHMSKTP